MIKSILVCTDGSPYGDTACEYGVHLAARLGARLMGLHVLDSRMLEGPLMADLSGWIGAQPYGAQLPQFRLLMEEKGEAVLRAFTDRCQKAGVSAEAVRVQGHPAREILAAQGRAELLVLGQKGEHAPWGGELLGSTLERVVRRAANPCLVTPSTFTPISKILAAYDGSGYASKALHEAAELAAALGVELIVLTALEGLDPDRVRQVSEDGAALARAHDARATSLTADGRSLEAILRATREQACNLIVVGAYGHSRIRQWILGSTPTRLMAEADVPVMVVR